MWKEYTNAILGLCVAVVAFVGLAGTSLVWTTAVLGALILFLGLWGAGLWQDYTNAIIGLAVVVVAFLGLSAAMFGWTLVILGAVVVALSLWDAAELSSPEFKQKHS